MKAILEVAAILALGLLARYVVVRLGVFSDLDGFLNGRRNVLYPAIVGLEGSLLGFTIASLTIMLGYTSNPRLDIVRKSAHWSSLFASFTRCIRWAGYGVAFSLAALLFDRDGSANLVISCSLAAVLAVSIVVLARMLWVLHRLVAIITRPHARSPGH